MHAQRAGFLHLSIKDQRSSTAPMVASVDDGAVSEFIGATILEGDDLWVAADRPAAESADQNGVAARQPSSAEGAGSARRAQRVGLGAHAGDGGAGVDGPTAGAGQGNRCLYRILHPIFFRLA